MGGAGRDARQDRNAEWRTEESLWFSAKRVNPNNAGVWSNVASVLRSKGEHEQARLFQFLPFCD